MLSLLFSLRYFVSNKLNGRSHMIEKAKWLISALWGRYKLDKKLRKMP